MHNLIISINFQRLADILFAAAEEGGYVDPNKVEQILKVPNPKNSAASKGKTVIEEIITGPYRLLSHNKHKRTNFIGQLKVK